MRLGITPYTLSQRLSKIELLLGVRETPEMILSREMLTYWLATSEHGADLYIEITDACEARGGIMSMVRTQVGRAMIDRVMTDMYATLEPSNVVHYDQ